MGTRRDPAPFQPGQIEILDVTGGSVVTAPPQHLIEVAIGEVSVPAHGKGGPTHDGTGGRWIEGGHQPAEVLVQQAAFLEESAEAADRHVGDRQESVESDSVPLS
jgi:hypothetical protein